MEFMLSKNRKIKLALGFSDISLIPGESTVDPNDVDVSWQLGEQKFELPILAAAMDGVVDVNIARMFGEWGGLGVLNLEGIYTRYDDYQAILDRIVAADNDEATKIFQEVYREPVKPELIAKRIKEIQAGGVKAAGSLTPAGMIRFGQVAEDSGIDILVLQSTVTSMRHRSKSGNVLDIGELINRVKVPLMVGNVSGYEITYSLMEAGADAIFVGVGPGQACTTRGVTGVGVPQITATADCAAARDDFYVQTGKYVAIITDGGMRKGGEICKALATGADAIMTGSIFAGCPESPATPYHWGMATPDPNLPRGTRVKSDVHVPLKQVLFGPSQVTDGTQNLVGAIKSSMGLCGAQTIREFHNTDIAFSFSFMTEGKALQIGQQVGMGSKK
ncbi:MAG: GuaB3 family IMP dehydrogenase-related protein [Planctomycetales bacterium]|nr:GuaB3 family IMP dehydrogenase-related protein [bacterium]UNM07102.1 MAG: GuaB3 family IMP dehydrogenase-related protein [Planctomycetales bacterium]